MGSYPALAIQQPPGILDEYGKALQLKSLISGQQAQAQQIEMGKVQLDEARRQQAENATLRTLFQKNQGDLGQTIKDAAASGQVNPGTLAKLQQQHIQVQTEMAGLDEKKLKNALDSGNLFAGALDAVKQMPMDQRAQGVKSQLAILANKGIDTTAVSKTITSLPDLSDETLNGVEASLLGHNKAVEQEMKRREVVAQEETAGARKTTADTEAKKFAASMPGGALESVDKAELQDWLKKNPSKGPADFAKWKASLAPQAGIAAQGTPDAGLAAAVAKGQMKLQDVITPRMPLPLRQQFIKQVLAVNPDFKSSDFDIEKGVAKAFTSGAEAKNLTAFNTAIEHAKQLHTAAEALNVGDLRTLNKIGNALGYEFGSDKVTNFNVIKNALSGEISKVFKGGQATDAEIKAVQGPFDSANSPAQLKGAIRNAISLMNSKRDALKQQYQQGSKAQPNFGEGGGTVKMKAPNGQVKEVSPEEVEHYRSMGATIVP